MRYLVTILLLISSIELYAQNDTIYISYLPSDYSESIEVNKHSRDPNPSTVFPFGGGKIYAFNNGKDRLYFSFYSYPMPGSERQFSYLHVDSSYLENKEIIDWRWIKNHSRSELIDFFEPINRSKPIIMMIDKEQSTYREMYMVRVYFSYEAME